MQITSVRQGIGEHRECGHHGSEQSACFGVVDARVLVGQVHQPHDAGSVSQRTRHPVAKPGRAHPLGMEPALPKARPGVLTVLGDGRGSFSRRALPYYEVATNSAAIDSDVSAV